MKKLIPLILILAILAGITMANLGERRIYPLPSGVRYRFTSSRDPNNFWDDVNDVYTMHGLLEVDDINTPKFKVKDVNVTGDLTLSGLTKDRLLYLDNDSNVASVADLSVWIIGTTDQIIVVGADGKVTLSLPQDYDTGATPTLAGLTITGNSVFGLNSSVFQPAAGGDSTTFFQIKNAAGAIVGNFDTENIRFGIGTDSPVARLDIAVPAIDGREVILRATISDASGDQWAVFNATEATGEFSPTFQGHKVTDADPALTFIGMTDNAKDSGTNPMLLFTARKVDNGDDPLNPSGLYQDIETRPILAIRNRATNLVVISENGNVGFGGEVAPETLTEWTHAQPYLTLHNSTHEDTDGGRESRLIFKGEKTDESEHTLGIQQFSHDGTGDDYKAKYTLSLNKNAGADTLSDILTATQDSFVVQAPTDSTTFFQILDAAGTQVVGVDTTNGRIIIGTGTPGAPLEIKSPGRSSEILCLKESNSSTTIITFFEGSGGRGNIEVNSGSGSVGIRMEGNGTLSAIGSSPQFQTTNASSAGLVLRTGTGGASFFGFIGGAFGIRNTKAGTSSNDIVRIEDGTPAGLLALTSSGNIGFSEIAPETLLELTHTQPYITLHNETHENTDGGRESRIIFKGEQGVDPFAETELAMLEVSHDGSGNDQLGKFVLSVNTGAGLVEGLRLDSLLRFGIATTPTARLHLPAGVATAGLAPLKLTSGTNLTTPEAGAIEYDGTHYSVTEVIDRRVLSVASDTIITSTSAASDSETVIYTATISADELHVGKAIIVRAFGDITTNDGAAVVTIRVKIGAVTVVTLPSPARVVSNEPWHLFAFMTIRTVGAGGTVSTHGHIMIEDTEIHTNVSSTALNTTAVNNVTITAQWVTTDAGDILTIDQGIMEVLN